MRERRARAFSSIGIAGTNASDFGQTNTCGSKLAVNATCQDQCDLQPAAVGNRSRSSTAAKDNAPGSPQTVPLSGKAFIRDFFLGASLNTVTITPGQAANYNLTASPVNAFSQTVTLSCTGGAPQSTCAVTPSSATLNGSGSATGMWRW